MDYAAARQNMIDSQIRTSKVTDSAVIAALAALPRELFVAESHRKLAYIDRPVPLGAGRRMMEPMYLARLLQVADLQPKAKALVVGAGTGYGAAIISKLAAKVVALESAPELAAKMRANLAAVGIGNVTVVEGDLAAGRPKEAPFDFILIDGAVEILPDALTAQLAEGGMLATVVMKDSIGQGVLIAKADGVLTRREIFDAETDVLPGFTRPQRFVF
ncbi:MAG TPA: protein-L-isoaspartate O-methyltransferase [Dongiaceae bacterium]|jgi:protein-L-isoaspartate(D-aspartate) O-methyltransferase|nr:protein-L-isoaspartate O-methyltransferase [Dongiaceae bacterium]